MQGRGKLEFWMDNFFSHVIHLLSQPWLRWFVRLTLRVHIKFLLTFMRSLKLNSDSQMIFGVLIRGIDLYRLSEYIDIWIETWENLFSRLLCSSTLSFVAPDLKGLKFHSMRLQSLISVIRVKYDSSQWFFIRLPLLPIFFAFHFLYLIVKRGLIKSDRSCFFRRISTVERKWTGFSNKKIVQKFRTCPRKVTCTLAIFWEQNVEVEILSHPRSNVWNHAICEL